MYINKCLLNKYRIIFSTRPMLVCVGIYHATLKYKIKESPKKSSLFLRNRNNQGLLCSITSCRNFFIEVELKTTVFRDFDFIFFKAKKCLKLYLNFKITHSESILVYTLIRALCCQHLVVRGKRDYFHSELFSPIANMFHA